MKKELNLIFASQEYNQANHKELWEEISKKSECKTIVINIGADLVVSLIKNKKYRIVEALKGPQKINDKLILLRPLFLIRPEVSSKVINRLNVMLLKLFLKNNIKDINQYQVNIIHYGGIWSTLLENLNLNANYYYYVMDEVRSDAHNNKANEKRTYFDEYACEKSNKIFLMSSKLIENRRNYLDKIHIIGNGASVKSNYEYVQKIEKSVGLVGNIRNWIDFELLESIVKMRKDLHFGIVGNIEANMEEKVNYLLSNYSNVKYYGVVSKEEVHKWYRKFNTIIVPYVQNDFMMATRPIKIVESIFALTPVITIPISGYEESSFIRFATNPKEFSSEIDYLLKNKIHTESTEYLEFIQLNSWSRKAEEIISYF